MNMNDSNNKTKKGNDLNSQQSTNDFNKFQHIAHIDQQQKILQNRPPFIYNNRVPASFIPRIPISKSLYHNYPLSVLYPTAYQQQISEQETLDNGFLNLFGSNDRKISASSNIPESLSFQNQLSPLKPNVSTSHQSKTKTLNLIDFDNVIDTKALTAIELFDPLAQIKIEKKMEPKIEPKIEPFIVETINETKVEEKIKEEVIKEPIYSTKELRIENFKIIDLISINEFEQFEHSINELSNQINFEKKQLSNLIVFSPTLGCPITNKQNIKLSVKYAPAGTKQYQQESLTPSLNATVETLVYQVLVIFNVEDLNTNKYLLKIHGLEEYLPINANLAELKYLHECISENRDPSLILTELNAVNTDLSAETSNELIKQFKINFKDKNQTKNRLETLVRGILQNKRLIEESIESNSNYYNQLDSVLNWCQNLKEKLKLLILLVYGVHFNLIEDILFSLELIEKNLRNYQSGIYLKEKQPFINNIDFNSGSTDSNLNKIYSDLVNLSAESLNAILLFMNCATSSFNLPFKLEPIYSCDRIACISINDSSLKKKIETIQSEEKFLIKFCSVNRLSQILNDKTIGLNSDLFVKLTICYGTKQLDYVIVRLDKFEKLVQKKNEYFYSEQRILFRNTDLCLLPREAILLIQICSLAVLNYNSNDLNFTDEKLYKYHAWGSLSLFKGDLTLLSGNHLICLFTSETPRLCTSASNIYSETCPVIQIEFQNDNFIYAYPSLNNECDCILKDFHQLTSEVKENLLQICNKSVIADTLNEDEIDLIHKYYLYLNGIPNALNKVYLSFASYDYSSLIHFYAFLKQCDLLSLTEALELLLPHFPDEQLRNHAVNSLKNYSPESISLYLPQLLEALKYERTHNSKLVEMLLGFASKNIRFSHKLYWQLSEFNSRKEDFNQTRYELLYQSLMHFFSEPMFHEIELEQFLVKRIHEIGLDIKQSKDNDKLFNQLEQLSNEWSNKSNNHCSCRLPYNISYCTREVDIKSCSYISSFTMPLKLVFKNLDSSANSFYTIYKIGDDLRQDMFVLQLINVMKQLWIMEDLDLSVLTFTCLQTGDRRGFIEMVTNAETLKEIQKGEVMKAFKKSCINDWLKTHNPNPNNFKKAVNNFTKSCAAYSVATYILGIGDRHNDNIMIKHTGQMFHIDFGKYLGDAQTFAGFKRDRTPFLFTPDMFYVINQGKQANSRFQEYVDMSCKAFQILRKNYHHLLSLLELMSSSGIPGLNKNAIQFVYRNLMIDLNEDASSNAFKKLIYESLSRFASFNFAIHTLAQPKTVNSSNYFSFVTHTFSAETDGKIESISLIEQTSKGSIEFYKCLINRETSYDTNEVYRTFDEFCELYQLLSKTFPALKLPETPSLNKFKETKLSIKRRNLIEALLCDIKNLQAEISQSDIIYTFFHSILRDQKEDLSDTEMIEIINDNNDTENENHEAFLSGIKGQIQVKLKFKENKFYVNCLQCRNLTPPNNQPISSLKPYVKCYLRPDATKATKKKVQALFNGANPIFTETMEYDINLIDFKNRTLEISVLNNKLNNKEKIGSVEIILYDINWNNNEYIKWYDLR